MASNIRRQKDAPPRGSMAGLTCKKPTAPDYYWVNVVAELQALVPFQSSLWFAYESLLENQIDFILLDVNAFCYGHQPAFVPPLLADFISGAYISLVTDYALASVYYNLCRDTGC